MVVLEGSREPITERTRDIRGESSIFEVEETEGRNRNRRECRAWKISFLVLWQQQWFLPQNPWLRLALRREDKQVRDSKDVVGHDEGLMGNLLNVWGGKRHKGRANTNTLEGSTYKRNKKEKLACDEVIRRRLRLVPSPSEGAGGGGVFGAHSHEVCRVGVEWKQHRNKRSGGHQER
jgi:hypothetical protein